MAKSASRRIDELCNSPRAESLSRVHRAQSIVSAWVCVYVYIRVLLLQLLRSSLFFSNLRLDFAQRLAVKRRRERS